MVQQYEEEILQLERERERLNKRLRVKALDRGQRAAQMGVSVEKLTALEEMEVHAAGHDNDGCDRIDNI